MTNKLTKDQAYELDKLTFKAINKPLKVNELHRYNDLISIKQEFEADTFKRIK